MEFSNLEFDTQLEYSHLLYRPCAFQPDNVRNLSFPSVCLCVLEKNKIAQFFLISLLYLTIMTTTKNNNKKITVKIGHLQLGPIDKMALHKQQVKTHQIQFSATFFPHIKKLL